MVRRQVAPALPERIRGFGATNDGCRLGHRQSRDQRPFIAMGDHRRRFDEGTPPTEIIAPAQADEGGAHRWAVAGRADPAARRVDAQPRTDQAASRRLPAATGQRHQPPAQAERQGAGKAISIVAGGEQRLRGEEGVFGVIADHAAAEHQPLFQIPRETARDALTGQTFGWQQQAVAERRTDQTTDVRVGILFRIASILTLFHAWPQRRCLGMSPVVEWTAYP